MLKKVLFLSTAILLISCQAKSESKSADAAAGGNSDLEKTVKELQQRVKILEFALESRGVSVKQAKLEMEMQDKVHDIPIEDSPTYGPADAKVTVVEFSDFQCPYCAKVTPKIQEVMKKYPNDVRFVYKHFPLNFHKAAPPAHAASIAAHKQGKFWEFRYEIAPFYKKDQLTEALFLKSAEKVGLDMAQFKEDMALAKQQGIIDRDKQLGGQVGVRGTPSFYINGKKVQGFSESFVKKALDEANAGS